MTRAAHRSVRRERPCPGPHRSRGSGSWAGWPSSSHRPASIDPFEAHSIVASLSRLARSPVQHFEGQRLSAPRVRDRPRLVGWSSLHRERRRSLTSLVADPGTASPVPGPAGSWLAARLATHAEAFTRVAKIAAALRLALQERRAIETLSVVSRPTKGCPGAAERRSLSCWRATRGSRTVLAAETPLRASARGAETSSASAVASTFLADRRAPAARGVRRTDFCLLTSSYEHPRLVGSRCVTRGKRLRDRGDRLPHASAIRFGGPHVISWRSSLWALSSRGDACWPCLWHPCRLSHDGHCARARMGRRQRRRGRLLGARVNDARWRNDPRCLPSIESLRPATPFRAPGSGLVPAPRCGHRDAGRRRPLARADPLGSGRARPPFTRPVASGVALLWVSASLADFCNR